MRSLRTWLLASYLVVLLLPLVALVGTGALATDLQEQTRADLQHQGAALARLALAEWQAQRRTQPDATLDDIAPTLSTHLTELKPETLAGYRIVDPAGYVVAASAPLHELDRDLSADPTVVAALAGLPQVAVRPRDNTGRSYDPRGPSRHANVRIHVARPILTPDGRVLGAVLLSRTPREELQALYQLGGQGLALGALFALLCTGTLALVWGNLLSRSLISLAQGADRIAAGDLDGLSALAKPSRSHVKEVGQVARAATTMSRRLADRLAYIQDFAANVSHEFKTPLATLRATLELLSDDPEMPPPQRARFFSDATAAVAHLEALLSGLFDLARAEQAADRAPLDLHTWLSAHAAAQSLPLTGHAAPILGDARLLDRALHNLIDNARTHGGPALSLHAAHTATHTTLSVADDGPPISPNNQARLFTRFFTTRRGQGGTGLGLALVATIAQAHGGEATYERRGDLNHFLLRLPRPPLSLASPIQGD